MDRKQILEQFAAKAPEWIRKNPPLPYEEFTLDHIPQHVNQQELLDLVRAEHGREPIGTVLDFGGGIGRWVRFWLAGIGAESVTIIEPVAPLAAEAEKRWEALDNVEVIAGDLLDLDPKFDEGKKKRQPKRAWDVGFTFTVLEHVPPADIAAVAEILKRRCRRLILIEMVTATAKAGFCDYVFQHNYAALFGPPKFSRMIDENKAVMIF